MKKNITVFYFVLFFFFNISFLLAQSGVMYNKTESLGFDDFIDILKKEENLAEPSSSPPSPSQEGIVHGDTKNLTYDDLMSALESQKNAGQASVPGVIYGSTQPLTFDDFVGVIENEQGQSTLSDQNMEYLANTAPPRNNNRQPKSKSSRSNNSTVKKTIFVSQLLERQSGGSIFRLRIGLQTYSKINFNEVFLQNVDNNIIRWAIPNVVYTQNSEGIVTYGDVYLNKKSIQLLRRVVGDNSSLYLYLKGPKSLRRVTLKISDILPLRRNINNFQQI